MYKDITLKRKSALAWYYKNKEKSIARSTQWRKEHRDQYLESRKRQYKKRKESPEFRASEKIRVKEYYYSVAKPRMEANREKYRGLARVQSQKKLQKRRDLLKRLREELGGKCSRCGYEEDIRILQFHHHQKNKIDNVTNLQNLEKMEGEAKKCVLLCPNCHAIHHLNEHAQNTL